MRPTGEMKPPMCWPTSWSRSPERDFSMSVTLLTFTVIGLALVFDFLNGIHDSSNVVATMISSRALPPRVALWMTAAAEFCGPFIFGVAVAETIGGIVDPD